MSINKPILCLDFDGVIHSYTSGWKGADVILDPVVDGTFEFLLEAVKVFDINIFSSRSNQINGVFAMRSYIYSKYAEWLDKHQHADDQLSPKELLELLKFPTEKPPALISIDDRAITFTGIWPSVEDLKNFQPWNKRK